MTKKSKVWTIAVYWSITICSIWCPIIGRYTSFLQRFGAGAVCLLKEMTVIRDHTETDNSAVYI